MVCVATANLFLGAESVFFKTFLDRFLTPAGARNSTPGAPQMGPKWTPGGPPGVSKPSFEIEAVLGTLLNAIGGPLPPPPEGLKNHEN